MQFDAMEQRQKIARLTAMALVAGLPTTHRKTLRRRIHNLACMTGMSRAEVRRQADGDARYLIEHNLL